VFHLQSQGWEAYNAMVMVKNKIKPIAHWIAQLIMWRTGEGKHFFTSNFFNTDNANATAQSDTDEQDDEENISLAV